MFKIVLSLCLTAFCGLFSLETKMSLEKLKEKIAIELEKTNEQGEKIIQGWCSAEKAMAMTDLVLEKKPEVCVEIGAYGGSSIFPTAMALKWNQKGTIYAIDAWDNSECVKHTSKNDDNYIWWSKVPLNNIYKGFMNMLHKHNLLSHCKVLKMNSEKALAKLPMGIDILHIDGDHSEDASYFDATHYLSKVKVGGYIWFDDALWFDTSTHYPTTKKAQDFLRQYCEEVKSVNKGDCILFKKVKESPVF